MLYAPNCFRDGEGRLLMVGWMQEGASRDSSQFNYSGCLTLPRVLTQQGMHLSLEWLVIRQLIMGQEAYRVEGRQAVS